MVPQQSVLCREVVPISAGPLSEVALYTLLHSFPLPSSYLMEKVHSKVFPALCRVHKRPNEDLVQRSRYLRGTMTPSGVGVSEDYNCPYTQTLLHLNQLEGFKSPLEQLYCLQDAMVRTAIMPSVRSMGRDAIQWNLR